MKNLLTSLLILFTYPLWAQSPTLKDSITARLIDLGEVSVDNEDFQHFEGLKKTLKDVDIVMLGEQSHGEGTTYATKIKLVKYLHEEMGFDILAFESGFFDCAKAWSLIEQGEDVSLSLGKGVFNVWSTTKEFRPLARYIETQAKGTRPLMLRGFDGQVALKMSSEYLATDLRNFLQQMDHPMKDAEGLDHFARTVEMITSLEFKKYKKENAIRDTAFLQQLLNSLQVHQQDSLTSFWIQCLKGAKGYLSDIKLKTDHRDRQMADNLSWLVEHHPGQKIICWGATSHFLYNGHEVRMKLIPQLLAANYYKKQPMMGHYVKEKYGQRVYTIGFVAYQGVYGYTYRRKIKPPKEDTLEYLLGQTSMDNAFLPLTDLKISPLRSRPLGNMYMKNDITRVMDGVIFNRKMVPLRMDSNLFLKIYPENKYIKPEVTE
ncbi:MAG: erythromycin esterase family protein [Bacteroidota bacterium]